MADFPTLTVAPVKVDIQRQDHTIKSKKEGGYVQTRARNTRLTIIADIVYPPMSIADKNLIDAHIVTQNGGAASFTWSDSRTGTKTVRYSQLPKFSASIDKSGRWDCSFQIEEV